MKIEQNFENKDSEQKTGNEEAHNAWVEEMNRKQAVFGNFKMDKIETPINEEDFWEIETEDTPEVVGDLIERDEHLERIEARIDQVKQRQAELSEMTNNEDVRGEKRELEKELESLEKEIEKNAQNKELEKIIAKEAEEKSEHLKNVKTRIDQVKQRQAELSEMTNNEDVREEKRELEKELESLEKEVPKNEKGEGTQKNNKKENSHIENVILRIDKVKQRQAELSERKDNKDNVLEKEELKKELDSLEKEIEKSKTPKEVEVNSKKEKNPRTEKIESRIKQVTKRQEELLKIKNNEDVREEKRELEKELESLRKEIGEKIDEQTIENLGGNTESKNSEENIKNISKQLYSKISFYEDKRGGLGWLNIIGKNKLKKIIDNLELINRTIIFDKMVNTDRLKNLSKTKELKEICDSIKNETSIEKTENDDSYKPNN